MNALSKAFATSQRSLSAAKASAAQTTEALMARGPSGLPVHREDLMRSEEQLRHFKGWVYSSIRPIAQRIAGQRIHVGRKVARRKLGTKATAQPADVEPIESHPLLDLFADPNDLQVAWSLIYSTIASLELTGRQLWWMPKRKAIYPIPTSWVRSFEGTSRFTAFNIKPPYTAETFPLPADECVYLSYPDPADPHGAVSPLQAVAGAVDADEHIVRSQLSMFARGIHPSHVVLVGKSPDKDHRPRLTGAQQRQIVSAIQKRYGSTANHGEPLILDGLIEDVRKLSNTPAEMDWTESSKSTKARIMQGFGTNPIIAGEIEGANRASATVADRHFVDSTINPKIELLSQCLTAWLRPMFADESLVVWLEPCVAHDAEMRLKWAQALAKHSAITGDELRELSPFDLELGNFPDPVAGGGKDPGLEQANETAERAIKALEGLDEPMLPTRLADRVLSGSKAV